MATSPTHRTETVHIDEQSCRATASIQWLLEKESQAGTHRITNSHIQMLVCGEEGFRSIAGDLNKAQHSIDLVCWGFDPAMELERKGSEWPRGETYGDILRRLATRQVNPVKIRLLIWYATLGSRVQDNMPGYVSWLGSRTSDEWSATAAALGGGVYLPSPQHKKPPLVQRADHCVEWWRWAFDKRNAQRIEIIVRNGDPDKIRETLGVGHDAIGEVIQPSSQGLPRLNEKSLLEDSGTHHQKTVLIDYQADGGIRAVGYVMGLNSMTGYWDTREHQFNDPRREYDQGRATETAERVDKARGDVRRVRLDPYQDYACRLRGEALEFVHRNFATAWMRAGGSAVALQPVPAELKRAKFPEKASRVQIIRTQPEEGDKTIKKAYFHATEFARNYLYMENQYFQYEQWASHLKSMRRNFAAKMRECGAGGPSAVGILHAFIVIPRPERAQMVPRTFDTVKTLGRSDQMHDEDIEGVDTGQYLEMKAEREAHDRWAREYAVWLKKFQPGGWMYAPPQPPRPPQTSEVGRYEAGIKEPSAKDLDDIGLKVLIGMLVSCDDGSSQLKQRGPADRYRQIYIHSKLLMIDDVFFTVGSANLNQRSMAADSEINLATEDPEKARALRKDVWGLHTGGTQDGRDGSPPQIADTFAQWQKLMRKNDEAKVKGEGLEGFLCTFRDSKFSFTRYA